MHSRRFANDAPLVELLAVAGRQKRILRRNSPLRQTGAGDFDFRKMLVQRGEEPIREHPLADAAGGPEVLLADVHPQLPPKAAAIGIGGQERETFHIVTAVSVGCPRATRFSRLALVGVLYEFLTP